VLCVVVATLIVQPAWDVKKLFAGLFRHHYGEQDLGGSPDAYIARLFAGWRDDFVIFHEDDPSTSVAVFDIAEVGSPARRSILNNGKSDGNVPGDNVTTGLLALLPALFAEKCERAFVIGYGTGMSVGELAALRETREVVVAEISRGVIGAAPLFEDLNRNALASPKTRIVRSDAYRASSPSSSSPLESTRGRPRGFARSHRPTTATSSSSTTRRSCCSRGQAAALRRPPARSERLGVLRSRPSAWGWQPSRSLRFTSPCATWDLASAPTRVWSAALRARSTRWHGRAGAPSPCIHRPIRPV
jgi:hypothetical protein